MGIAAEIVRADLKDYVLISIRKNLTKHLLKKQRSASCNNLSSTIELLYSVYQGEIQESN